MKAKITMAISMGCVALILTMIMFTQFKTVEKTDITAIETMRETELRTELASWKAKYEDIETKIEERETRIEEYKQELDNNENSSVVLQNEVKEAEEYLGLTDIQGEGIIVTLSDNEHYGIDYADLLSLVNELNVAGAEAISINDERIVNKSDIFSISNQIILVNTKKISAPYTVKAIGNKKYLESALIIKGGYLDFKTIDEGKSIEYTVEDNIIIPSYDGDMSTKYIVKNEKVEEIK